MLVHESPAPGEALWRYIWTVGQDASRPLIVDLVRPASLKHVGEGKLHEQVPERRWVEDTGIIEDSRDHGSVAQA